ncbi:hypothetical protein HMPREF1982_02639 [Clostridiales bacterium oral taxon 876 str. F0540]|nr:hypothetical protein HMPREF1982_02639 [Clostridiales bacterium oral taxon 876 str. F0540]
MRRSKSINKFIIVMVSISIFGLTGVSYAYWTDSAKMTASAQTGNISARFVPVDEISGKPWNKGGGCYNLYGFLSLGEGNIASSNIINIFNCNWFKESSWNVIKFEIENNGSVPIRIYTNDINACFYTNYDNKILGSEGVFGFILSDNIQYKVDNKSNVTIDKFEEVDHIDIDKGKKKVLYLKVCTIRLKNNIRHCTLTIPYTQFNVGPEKSPQGNYNGWTKSLKFEFKISQI